MPVAAHEREVDDPNGWEWNNSTSTLCSLVPGDSLAGVGDFLSSKDRLLLASLRFYPETLWYLADSQMPLQLPLFSWWSTLDADINTGKHWRYWVFYCRHILLLFSLFSSCSPPLDRHNQHNHIQRRRPKSNDKIPDTLKNWNSFFRGKIIIYFSYSFFIFLSVLPTSMTDVMGLPDTAGLPKNLSELSVFNGMPSEHAKRVVSYCNICVNFA